MIPNVLTIAGSDSGGGAGVQADLKTFSALGTYGCSVLCALTAQNTQGVAAIHDIPAEFVRAQLDAVFSDIRIDAVKIGMLNRAELVEVVATSLAAFEAQHVILDPVMVATSGDRLLEDAAVEALVKHLVPMAEVLTPNLPEAAALLGRETPKDEDEMHDAAQALLQLGPRWVLLKGGHLDDGTQAIDLLVTENRSVRLTAPRIRTENVHGTGCTLSSALAAARAQGMDVERAARVAKTYLTEALRGGQALSVGQGRGPVHHFVRQWEQVTLPSPERGDG